jgi:AraC-like DNA-binding protein
MTFDGPAAMTVWKGLHLPQEPRIAGRCPEELFLQLEDEILNYSQDGLRMASATTFRILMLAANHTPTVLPTYDFVEQARKVIEAQFQNPHLNIGVIAKRLDVDRSQLSRKFHDVCGVSPVQYLINLRIQHGMDLLANSSLMVKEIATRSGFSDPNYFTKAILKYTGGTVRDYRQSNQVNYTNVQD